MKQWLVAAILTICVASLSGCETVKGFGQDLKNTGENISDAASKI